jgi:hypothetical protein
LRAVRKGADTDALRRTLLRVRDHLKLEQIRQAERLLDQLIIRLEWHELISATKQDSAA